MLEIIKNYSVSNVGVFEELVKKDGYELNHVIIEVGNVFPKHPTDANVTIIVVKGELSLQLEDQNEAKYYKGQIIEISKGTASELGNKSDDLTEVFVIKSKRTKA